jgi:clan AA aspartic protease
MITGSVNSQLQAIIELALLRKSGHWHSVKATVDTGYNGFVVLPPSVIKSLNATCIGSNFMTLADGRSIDVQVYLATVEWNGKQRVVAVDVSDSTILVGMAMLQGHDLNVKIQEGGSLTIKAFDE